MKKSFVVGLLCALIALPAAAQNAPAATKGQVMYASNGQRIGTVARLNAQGDVEVIIDGKIAVVPASTVTTANGNLKTSLSKPTVMYSAK